ncbi:LytR C-terminal domain-containing protein [Pedococcus dokdonensis]|uniref:LytR C-terminal domain-containing protein n=1 Tax=Pedococcus dokdonensis TaxID=443156 RepID=UPI000B86D854
MAVSKNALPLAPDVWRRRQLRRVAVFVCLPGLTLGGASLSSAYVLGLWHRPPPASRGQVVLTVSVARDSFDLRVLNGSGRTGLAAAGASQLAHAGFRTCGVANAPESLWTDHAADIRYGPDGLPGARLAAAQIAGSRLVADHRVGTGVDVVLGTAFEPSGPASAKQVSYPQKPGRARTCAGAEALQSGVRGYPAADQP